MLNLVIDRNGTGAVKITGNNATVRGNYIGTDTTGKQAAGNAGIGVSVASAENATITGNVISANSGHGISITGAGSKSISITNNKIGGDVDGKQDLGNAGDGISFSDGSSSTISNNIIIGNDGNGVTLTGASATQNTVADNRIGANAEGFGAAQGNDGSGIVISSGAHGNTIDGNNTIGANKLHGVHITGSGSDSNTVAANYIGTNLVGNDLGNKQNGVLIDGDAASNTIGSYNKIVYNDQHGVHISGSSTNNNTVKGNDIGAELGTAKPNEMNGVLIDGGAQGNKIEDNQIGGNKLHGVQITGSNTKENTIYSNDIGYLLIQIVPNEQNGVLIDGGATKNTVDYNTIGGNKFHGVQLSGSETAENTVKSNYIGLSIGGGAQPNERNGVLIDGGAHTNTIGPYNTISGNKLHGVQITGSGTHENTVNKNYIGFESVATTSAVPNEQNGVLVDGGAYDNTIDWNRIGHNKYHGVQISGSATHGNKLTTNRIGMNGGDEAAGNTLNGVLIDGGAYSNTLSDNNMIGANGRNGVELKGSDTRQNTLTNNVIGTKSGGNVALPNADNGVLIQDGARNNTIGPDNTISGNSKNGIRITGSATHANVVSKNVIGTKNGGGAALPNGENGVLIDEGAYDNQLTQNTISGNTHSGVRLAGTSTHGNTLYYNWIGTNSNGSVKVPNSRRGVFIEDGAYENTLDQNTISGNAEHGVHLSGTNGADPHHNTLIRNYIGLADSGSALGNTQSGVVIDGGSHSNTIGTPGNGNKLSGNGVNGLYIKDSDKNSVQGNNIGAYSAVGNGEHGIRITNGNENTIGGTGPGEGNNIGYNGADGVFISSGDKNAIRRNSIYDNGGLGIDLGTNGPTAPDLLDADTDGGNTGQNFPLITKWTGSDVEGILHSAPGTYTIEIYSNTADDPSGFGEGKTYIGQATVVVNAEGHGSWKAAGVSGTHLSAVALDASGNTSEFGTRARAQLEQINFKGTDNQNIRINPSTDIGTPGGAAGSEDIEWKRAVRTTENKTAVAWATGQSAPAAFIKGKALNAEVKVTAEETTEIKVRAINTGAYGNINEKAIAIASGEGTETVTSASHVTTIAANSLTLAWEVTNFKVHGIDYPAAYKLEETKHRIYTIHAAGIAAREQGEPWAEVLELSANLASGKGAAADASDAVAALANGIHHSSWKGSAANVMFLDAKATMVYGFSGKLTTVTSTSPRKEAYPLGTFLSGISGATFEQECSDYSHLLSIFAASVGIDVVPTRLTGPGGGGLVMSADYYPAGKTATEKHAFNYHQFGMYGGKVYDAATRPGATGDANIGQTLVNYLNAVFPTQTAQLPAPGYVTTDVVETDATPLVATGEDVQAAPEAVVLRDEDLLLYVDVARELWEVAGASPQRLAEVRVVIGDLGDRNLGLASPSTNTIRIDVDAVGAGWFLDPTPRGHEEFRPHGGFTELVSLGGESADRYDLLTVLIHEFGHILGLGHHDNPQRPGGQEEHHQHDTVMAESLPVGTRRLPDGGWFAFSSGSDPSGDLSTQGRAGSRHLGVFVAKSEPVTSFSEIAASRAKVGRADGTMAMVLTPARSVDAVFAEPEAFAGPAKQTCADDLDLLFADVDALLSGS